MSAIVQAIAMLLGGHGVSRHLSARPFHIVSGVRHGLLMFAMMDRKFRYLSRADAFHSMRASVASVAPVKIAHGVRDEPWIAA
jgi:hypothetical protein